MNTRRRVFISYSHLDMAVVEHLERDLDSLGCDVWCDRELSGGQRWWDGILESIRQCDVFVFAISEAAVRSEACGRELAYATALGKSVLPVLAGQPVPEGLLPPVLSETQRVDVRESDARSALALGRALMQTAPASPLPEQLPAPPPVPISYLSDLKTRVEQTPLPLEDQWKLLTELEERLTRPEEQESALALLRRFADRGDLMQGVGVSARRIVAAHDLERAPVVQPVEPLVATPSPADPPRGRSRRRWIAAAIAAILIAGSAIAAVVFLGRDDEVGSTDSTLDATQDSLGEFCDRARSADVATDRAQAFAVTPEADPAEMERLWVEANDEMTAVAIAAPADIRAATVGLADAFETQMGALRSNDWKLAGMADQLVLDPTTSQQNSAFAKYVGDQCEIDWDEVGGFVDVSTAAEGLATAFAAGLDIAVTREEAECMAASINEEIDGDRVLALYGQAFGATQAEGIILAGAVESCIDVERIAPGFGAIVFAQLPGTTEEEQTCLARGVLEEITLTVWAKTTVATPEFTDQLRSIAEGCDVDPRLILPLVGG